MNDLLYVAERKIHGRLGLRTPVGQTHVQATVKVPPVLDVSGSRTREQHADPMAAHALVATARRHIEKKFAPATVATPGLQPNQWISFDMNLAQAAVHEDSERPPGDVALFAGTIPAGTAGQTRDLAVMLCGSVQHLRTQACEAGRMGSDTSWLHDLILEIERREESGMNVIPEFLSDIMPRRRGETAIEEAAFGVHGWIERDYPAHTRGRLRGHAIVLMDIDSPRYGRRLVLATPLYVEAVPATRPQRSPWTRLTRRDRTPEEPTATAVPEPSTDRPAPGSSPR
ncbi:SAVMC3_10250 family protein [Streptomyces sp. NPDC048202]|uniref:SAVMC3_10250 family protein n=1 Tax=Streptomyces sp. NPDC048202 TaxID=3365514 RepID=UPI0037191D84